MEDFETFWAAYPKKRKKLDALKAWQRVKPSAELLDEMLDALSWQRRSEDWTKEAGQYVPLPASWLRAGQWMDEPSGYELYQYQQRVSAACPHSPPCEKRWACGRRQQLERAS